MKTYEIYSIWADAITPPTADNPRRPSPPVPLLPLPPAPRGYTHVHTDAEYRGAAGVCAHACACARGVARRPEDCALALSTDAAAAAEGVIKMTEGIGESGGR